ncbi:hypothetical protein CCICO_03360 [Corynebacterium ciconiae DSM 44920]|uniref:hypothetical protein n=1 Tax=Corynebacterium ciconiae TaxID=227319 RepID=UPI000376FE77|nr:hypothetical protein [Corynebacterium ciconiae]WKD60711.1 hypothetical protein CCICO_03360 [Corynebacterium ciconiae DSM 44920]
MVLWPSAHPDHAAEVARLHPTATAVASAPATVPVIGEYGDDTGGTVVMALACYRSAVAASPTAEDIVRVTVHARTSSGTTTEFSESISFSQVVDNPRAAREHSSTDVPWAWRLSTLIASLGWRPNGGHGGLEITVFSDIPAVEGFGRLEATEAALALLVHNASGAKDDAPGRTRLAETLAHNAACHAPQPVIPARYHAALRSASTSTQPHLAVVDHADGSVTSAGHLSQDGGRPHTVIAVYSPGHTPQPTGASATRRACMAAACSAFGVDALRSLPDAPERICDWVQALHIHHSHGDSPLPSFVPSAEEAQQWAEFFAAEDERAQRTAMYLRSRREPQAYEELAASTTALAKHCATGGELDEHLSALAQLCRARGAITARPVEWDVSPAVLAVIPTSRAQHTIDELNEDGCVIVALDSGYTATVHQPHPNESL